MVRRLRILCFLVALWPGLALAQSAALMDAYNRYKALDAQGRYAEAERFARKALELSKEEFGPAYVSCITWRPGGWNAAAKPGAGARWSPKPSAGRRPADPGQGYRRRPTEHPYRMRSG